MNKISKARFLAVTAVMAAVATILRFLDFGLPILPGFLKIDFSLAPALISSYALGPWSGVIVVFITELIAISHTASSGVGELCNFILGSILMLSAGYFYRYKKDKKGALIGSLIGTFLMGALSMLTNYFITYPVYYNVIPEQAIMGMYTAILPSIKNLWQALAIFNLPLTLVKGIVSTLITFLLYKRLSPIMKGYQVEDNKKNKIQQNNNQNNQI